ncbi:MAG: 50S ribosomal protein L19 [Candidatus Omnitrophota bacterium]
MSKVTLIEEAQLKKSIPKFNVGDTVKVYVKIVEEDKTRIQAFEGIVIRKRGKGMGASFTVRKISYGEGLERIFPLHSPFVERVVVVKPGKVKRAKLYYLRKRVGKAVKVEEAMRGEKAQT